MNIDRPRFGVSYENWLSDVDAALKFFCGKTSADFPTVRFKQGWYMGLTASEAADQAWATIRDSQPGEKVPEPPFHQMLTDPDAYLTEDAPASVEKRGAPRRR